MSNWTENKAPDPKRSPPDERVTLRMVKIQMTKNNTQKNKKRKQKEPGIKHDELCPKSPEVVALLSLWDSSPRRGRGALIGHIPPHYRPRRNTTGKEVWVSASRNFGFASKEEKKEEEEGSRGTKCNILKQVFMFAFCWPQVYEPCRALPKYIYIYTGMKRMSFIIS